MAKEEKTLRRFIAVMASLGISLVIIWCIFYFLTLNNVKKNAVIQADAQSEAILSRIEDELLAIEEISYYLTQNNKVKHLAEITDAVDWYDYAAEVTGEVEAIIRADNPVSDIVIFGQNGLFYRIKGKCPNTVLTHVEYLLSRDGSSNFFTKGNGGTYIGNAKRITENGAQLGYVALLLDRTKLEYIFSDYSNVDYMGIVLMTNGQILCSNRPVKASDIEDIKRKSIIYKEQSIDITGLVLLVYCEKTISKQFMAYFNIALPSMILILIAIVAFYTYYWNKTALGPQERKLLESKMQIQKAQLENERTLTSLLKKQISVHFTVNTLTIVRGLINKGEKEEATHMCDELSRLLRYSNTPDELISLMEECYVLEQYIGIMQVRYPGRIIYNSDMEDYFESMYIPRMILQPIIENAIVHGLKDRDTIRISLHSEMKDALYIYINDDGGGIDTDRLAEINKRIIEEEGTETEGLKGIALVNIEKRIRIACGEGYGIRISSKPGEGTSVMCRLKIIHI